MKFIENAEEKIFASHDSYESMGGWIYYVAALVGALVGLYYAYVVVSDDTGFTNYVIYILSSIFTGLSAWCIMDSLIRIDNLKVAWGKVVFNCIGVLVAMVVGCAISVIVLVILAVILFFMILSGGLKGAMQANEKENPKTVTTSDGSTMNHITGNIYRSAHDGHDYEKIGDTMHRL